jgi:uncharacterized membrane protein
LTLLIIGVALFFGTHLLPGIQPVRAGLVSYLGEARFRGMYIAGSVIGMLALIGGKALAGYVEVWVPPLWSMRLAAPLMLAACILFPAMGIPCNIRRLSRHPMLWGMACWSAAHCLANGDLASIILFGSFGGYSLYEIGSLNARGAETETAKFPLRNDLAAVIAGLAMFALLVALHPYLFGVPVILPAP